MAGITPEIAHLLQTAEGLLRAGRAAEAAPLYNRVLSAEPAQFDALYMLAVLHSQQGRLDEALRLLGQAVAVNPSVPEVWYARGIVFHRLNHLEEAIADYDRALALRPQFIEALHNRGGACGALNRHQDALDAFDRALALRPATAQALNNRAGALLSLGRFGEALVCYDQALAAEPANADAHCNRGVALLELHRAEDAAASFGRALALQPSHGNALAYRGIALTSLNRLDEALANFDAALRWHPNRADVLYNRGNALLQLRRFEDAGSSFSDALRTSPDNADFLYGRANALSVLQRYEDAVRDSEHLLHVAPDYKYARGILVYAKLQCCDWRGLTEDRSAIADALRAGNRAVSPFDNGAISQSAEEQQQCARIWVKDIYPQTPAPLWRGERYGHDRVRVAYLSADFRPHPVALQMAGVFEKHDRTRFDITAFSFTPDVQGPFRDRLERAFDRFVDVRAKSDFEIARMLRESEIDIAVDLMGFTRECRTGIFGFRAAPVQVNFLGYAGTLGGNWFDYILADATVIPERQKQYYDETVLWLPDTFMPNDATRALPAAAWSRAQAGLPDKGFVFCSFNGNYKVTPEIFNIWMRLLRAVEGSVLWLPRPNTAAIRHLLQEAQARGVAPERLIFAPFTNAPEDHLARLGAADLFLDTQPYGAHSSASDALWAGLPVLTCLGGTFSSRVAASLLKAVGLPELIAETLPQYEAIALRLANDPDALAEIKTRLRQSRFTAPLFDTQRYCRNLEAAYRSMWERAQLSGAPGAFANIIPA